MSKTISAGRTPKINIESIGGDLSLVGWDGDDILFKADDEEMRINQDGEQVTVSCSDDLSLRVPKSASIVIGNIGGDASIRSLMGDIELKEIGGDLSMRDVNSISVGTVHADFSLRGAKGHLSIKSTHGDVSIRDVDGNVMLESVSDDLVVRDVRGNITANVAEDVVLYLNSQAGSKVSVTAGDDILLVMPPKANATLTLNADEIDVDWKGVENDEDATSRVITLGDGSASITLNAGGDIRVSNQADAVESAEDFGNFAGVGMDWSGFGDRVSRQMDQAMQRAQRKIDEAARRMERTVSDRVGRRGKVGMEVGRWSWDLSQKGVPMPPKPPVSDEERMAILKMLQDKKITAEEAEKLLSSLEGGL
ncbi:MAG: DUF4097 family beta strand repeat protein [Chloroflexi bacterium]|nr:DUF4097 family beta strand repeat protein [Chloroflexota bacterium]